MNKGVKWLVGGGLLLWLYNKFATATALMKTNIEVVGFRFFSIKSRTSSPESASGAFLFSSSFPSFSCKAEEE